MPRLDIQPEYLSEQESREIASRQILSFLIPSAGDAAAPRPDELRPAPSKSLFSLDALPEWAVGGGPAVFNWKSRDIYDVDGRLLFRDHTIDIGHGNEWRVRTAGSNLLRTPVWSVGAGPALNIEDLVARALAALRDKTDLEPLFADDEKDVRVVSHSYPKLGILCRSRSDAAKFVIDLGDLSIIPLGYPGRQENPESVTAVWSPYDIVVPPTIAHFRLLWERNMALLPSLPKSVEGLHGAVRAARASVVEEQIINPELVLVGQQTNRFCAAATAKMLLEHYGISRSQEEIADAMHIGVGGAFPADQVSAIPVLADSRLLAELDVTTSFSEAQDEIRHNRPFKTGGPIHARACSGFKVEEGRRNWLYIYDPWPSNQGRIYYEAWEAQKNLNYMYVRPLLFS